MVRGGIRTYVAEEIVLEAHPDEEKLQTETAEDCEVS